ncbi:MAG: hypothetical protein CMM60_08950 [Rhodospirillaceae bacterium]|jgi:hypothetical protein|nr:hypothetical protein [Rhodospirillaceae bacterium]|tara:strand:+ start:15864 stop:16382 length:519 start_codon:yes stop_codon:yes gene_type:complete
MKRTLSILFTAVLFIGPGASQAAEEWGIDGEKKARFEAKVVDILCELTGDCPADCGSGKRQLGLLRDDGTLVLAVKNFDIFAGAADDLKGFCNKRIVADGLLINNPKMPLFALQFKKLAPDGKWSRANQFGKDWSKANGGKKAGQWFKNDPRIKKVIAEKGVFGIPGLKPKE